MSRPPKAAPTVEYLYAVNDRHDPPRVERVRVKSRGEKNVVFETREAINGFSATMPHDVAERLLRSSPDAAVEMWRDELRDLAERLTAELKQVEKRLRGPAPKNAWEIEEDDE